LQTIKYTDMKKLLLTLIMLLPVVLLTAQSWNPYLSQGIISPAPLLPVQLNGTGVISFNIGNSGSSLLYYQVGSEWKIILTLSKGAPNNVDPIAAVSGSWKSYFTWTWNAVSNSYTAIQNQDIPAGPIQGNITIQYKVTVNTFIGSPNNGFNTNVTPPPYTNGINNVNDDNVSSYTYVDATDYGDAPISYGSAWHSFDVDRYQRYLGPSIDYELFYQASATANGDDLAGIDDENGVTIPALVRGTDVTITVNVNTPATNQRGYINGWIDWNGNGIFEDATELVIDNVQKGLGNYSEVVSVPVDAYISGPTYARFRFGPDNYDIYYGPTGAASFGEVEDYMVQIKSSAFPTITKTDGLNNFLPGTNVVYTVVVGNVGGPVGITGATVNDAGPGGGTTITSWSAVGAGGATPASSSGAGPIVNHTINLPIGGTMTYTITVSVPCTYTGNLVNTASVTDGSNTNYATDIDNQNEWRGGGTTDWNTASNWTIGIPDCSTRGAVIPAGTTPYPIINTLGNETALLTILDGATVTINPAKSLKVCGCTNINGPEALYVKSDKTSGNASFIDNGTISYNPTGSVRVDLYITDPTECSFCWHAVSSPIQEAFSSVFADDYLKSHNETSGLWSANITSLTRPLNVMQGYGVSEKATDHTKVFIGKLNTGMLKTHDDSVHRTLTSASIGYNLVGNPYPSFIDIESSGIYWGGTGEPAIDKKVWFMNASTAQNYQFWGKGVETWAGTAAAGKNIPSMQGFFVHVNIGGTGNTHFGVSNTARVAYAATWYKEEGAITDQLYLSAKDETTGFYDDALVIFHPVTLPGTDEWDAGKMYGGATAPQLYTVNQDNSKLTVNYTPFTGKTTIIPLNFEVQSNGTGSYKITASKLESFRSGTTITLVDKKTSINQVLTENPVYNFAYTEGEDAARFELHFYNPFFGIDDNQASQQVTIYSYENNIYVKDIAGKSLQGQIIVYNLLGQKVSTSSLDGGTLNKLNMNLEQGYYIVEVIANDQTYHGKVYLTR
jgi:hypothetical protein